MTERVITSSVRIPFPPSGEWTQVILARGKDEMMAWVEADEVNKVGHILRLSEEDGALNDWTIAYIFEGTLSMTHERASAMVH